MRTLTTFSRRQFLTGTAASAAGLALGACSSSP
ncbi:MAG: twin-arginine translocation signal domain-containing protein, partial [Deltaproteobacteria bacterium]|nr:twin-arginine translocation signal domain-containing protein [Deltaproteobacteria bacterium]